MISLILFLTCLFVAVAAGAMAAWSDFKGLIIPNWHSLVIMVAFFVAYALMMLTGNTHVFASIFSHLVSGLVIFCVTAALFAFKIMGAADSKLSTAFAFWVPVIAMPVMLFYITLAGGLIGLSALVLKKWHPVKNAASGSWVARVQAGEDKVPYGIAIVAGALACFIKLGYFSSVIMGFFPGS